MDDFSDDQYESARTACIHEAAERLSITFDRWSRRNGRLISGLLDAFGDVLPVTLTAELFSFLADLGSPKDFERLELIRTVFSGWEQEIDLFLRTAEALAQEDVEKHVSSNLDRCAPGAGVSMLESLTNREMSDAETDSQNSALDGRIARRTVVPSTVLRRQPALMNAPPLTPRRKRLAVCAPV